MKSFQRIGLSERQPVQSRRSFSEVLDRGRARRVGATRKGDRNRGRRMEVPFYHRQESLLELELRLPLDGSAPFGSLRYKREKISGARGLDCALLGIVRAGAQLHFMSSRWPCHCLSRSGWPLRQLGYGRRFYGQLRDCLAFVRLTRRSLRGSTKALPLLAGSPHREFMTMLGESGSRLVRISRCHCGAELRLKVIERRSADIEVRIFSCSQCLSELRVHLSNDEGHEDRLADTGL